MNESVSIFLQHDATNAKWRPSEHGYIYIYIYHVSTIQKNCLCLDHAPIDAVCCFGPSRQRKLSLVSCALLRRVVCMNGVYSLVYSTRYILLLYDIASQAIHQWAYISHIWLWFPSGNEWVRREGVAFRLPCIRAYEFLYLSPLVVVFLHSITYSDRW